MCRALNKIVLAVAMLGASHFASAHQVASTVPVKSAPKAGASSGSECSVADMTGKSTTVLIPAKSSVPAQIVSLSYQGADRIASVPVRHPAASEPGGNNSGWRSTTALLSTLALLGTIAFRRFKAGSS